MIEKVGEGFKFTKGNDLFSEKTKKRMKFCVGEMESKADVEKFKWRYLESLGKHVYGQLSKKVFLANCDDITKKGLNEKMVNIKGWLENSFVYDSNPNKQYPETFNLDCEHNDLNKNIPYVRGIFVVDSNKIDLEKTKKVQKAIFSKIINNKFLREQSNKFRDEINKENEIGKHFNPIYLPTKIEGLYIRISPEKEICDINDLRENRKISYSLCLLPDKDIFDVDENVLDGYKSSRVES